MISKVFFGAILAALIGNAMADSPLPPPTKVTACSPSGEYCATSDPATRETILSRRGQTTPLWKVGGWYAWIFVTNDGNRIIIGYPGLNLIPKGTDIHADVFRIYGPKRMVKSILLSDLYESKNQLTETVSHYDWVRNVYLDTKGHLVVERVDGQKISFDPSTGNRVN